MSPKNTNGNKRTEYKKTPSRKKRRSEAGEYNISNPAKTIRGKKGLDNNGLDKKKRKNETSRRVGLILTAVQLVASVVFLGALFLLNMLPGLYLVVIGVVLALFLGIAFTSQMVSKKNAIAGKVFSVILSLLLLVGSYYIIKTNGMIKDISGGGYKIDNMVVAVLADDPAETIEDAKSYQFGVQYAMKGEDVESAVSEINTKLGADITVMEFAGLNEQAAALHDGTVEAIIYNDGYTGILEEAFEGYSSSVKIIYSHGIKKEVENAASDVSVKDDSFNVFISGIDVYGGIETNSRSDVNMIATVNPTTHQVLLVNTPRDYYLEFPGITGGQKDKLTHAGIYGVDTSMATLGQLYSADMDFYARVNFTSLVQIVDALGGVDVESEQAFTTSEDTDLVMNVVQGTNHFNGAQALAFSRERQNVDGGDNQRGKNQQAVITAMIKKMISPAILMGANGIMNSVSGNVDTNMSQEQIQALIKQQLSSGGAWKIKSLAATGTGDEQYCYSYAGSPLYVTQPDMATVTAIQAAIDAVENGEVFEDSAIAE